MPRWSILLTAKQHLSQTHFGQLTVEDRCGALSSQSGPRSRQRPRYGIRCR